MLFKRLCLIIPLLIVLLCGCSKDIAINSGEQDNNNYSKTEENFLIMMRKKQLTKRHKTATNRAMIMET